MKRFRYAFDPVCLASCAAYVIGRWLIRPQVAGGFWHGQFTDLLLIPAALPPILWIQRRLGLRAHDQRPSLAEIGLHVVAWTLVAEVVAPLVMTHVTSDWRDALAYTAGAVMAAVWWTFA